VRRTFIAVVGLCLGVVAAASSARDSTTGGVVVLLPIQDRAGDDRAARAVEQALIRQLEERARVTDRERTRSVLRRMRLRNVDAAPQAVLEQLATELGAEWLVSATVHDAERRGDPRLTLSARVYRGSNGELVWAGFEGASGLDGRSVLGLGVIADLEALVPRVVDRLELKLEAEPTENRQQDVRSRPSSGAALGMLAIVPVGGLTPKRAVANAETVTEAARAALHDRGVALVSPGCASEALRRGRLPGWGGVDMETGSLLRVACGADVILTGSVERYDVGGAEMEPEPRVGLALRLLDAETGRILWMGSQERRGWDRQGLFRLGRVHSRGALTDAMMKSLVARLVRDRAQQVGRGEGTR
jgi:TolB-like protein